MSYSKKYICKSMQANLWHHKLFHFHLSFWMGKVWKWRENNLKNEKGFFDEHKVDRNSFKFFIISLHNCEGGTETCLCTICLERYMNTLVYEYLVLTLFLFSFLKFWFHVLEHSIKIISVMYLNYVECRCCKINPWLCVLCIITWCFLPSRCRLTCLREARVFLRVDGFVL